MPDDDELTLEGNAVQPPPSLKFKITSDDYSATTSLDANWQSKPFMAAVVKPVVQKLNRRQHKEPVDAKFLEHVHIDGIEVAANVDLATTSVASIVPHGTTEVALTFGLAPPRELKFTVCAGGTSREISFTITLNTKFMGKSFHDAVVVPFVHYFNKRVHLPVEAKQCVQVHIDGVKSPGATGTMVHKKTALQFLGRAPALVELFFSWDAVAQAEKIASGRDGGYSRLQQKIPIQHGNVTNERTLNFSHSELSHVDGAELAKKLKEHGPLAKLTYLYLEHNMLGDGAGMVATGLNRQNTPGLKRLVLSSNRITSAGVMMLCAAWGGTNGASESGVEEVSAEIDEKRKSPQLELLVLEDNHIKDEGALALAQACDCGALTVAEVRLHGNPAITPAVRARLAGEEYYRQGHGVLFRFDQSGTGSCFMQDGEVVDGLKKDPRSKALDIA